ncbi:putative RNA-binding protein EIF1AD [Arapaima gigas]
MRGFRYVVAKSELSVVNLSGNKPFLNRFFFIQAGADSVRRAPTGFAAANVKYRQDHHSGMSQATKRKHVVKEVLGDFIAPSGSQQIVRIVGSPGNNLHEAITAEGHRFLVSMPTKFRKNIWIKRGWDFVIVDPIEEGEKVKGEICVILYKDHIRHLRTLGIWPEGFCDNSGVEVRRDEQPDGGSLNKEGAEENGGTSDSEDDDSDLFVNTNRVNYHYSESEEEEEESDEENGD